MLLVFIAVALISWPLVLIGIAGGALIQLDLEGHDEEQVDTGGVTR